MTYIVSSEALNSTHSLTNQPWIGYKSRKVCQTETDVLTTDLHRQNNQWQF